MTTSFANYGNSADSTANNGDNDESDLAPSRLTDSYRSLKTTYNLMRDAIGAHQHITMDDTEAVPVQWVRAVGDVLYERNGSLGELQGDTDYTAKEYIAVYGDTMCIKTDDLTDGERSQLRGMFKKSDNHDESDADGDFQIPVINGERLPVLVADEDVLEQGKAMLEELLESVNDAPSTTDTVDDDDAEFPVLEGTLDDLDAHLADSTPDEDTLREMLEAEKSGKDRKGGKRLINDAIDAHSTTDDDEGADDDDVKAAVEEADDEDDDDDAGSTVQGIDAEELATTVATAVVQALNEQN